MDIDRDITVREYKTVMKKLLGIASRINYYRDTWGDKQCVDEICIMIKKFWGNLESIDFSIFTWSELQKMDFQEYNYNLLLVPMWALPLIAPGTELTSVTGEKSIYKESGLPDFINDTNWSSYGFTRKQITKK